MPAPDCHLLTTAFRKAVQTSWVLIRVLLPAYIVVDLLKETPVIPALGRAFGPLMAPLGLPGEAAMALVLGCLVNLYASVGILAALGLTSGQLAVCGLMLGLSHTLIIEGAVLRSTGTRYLLLTFYRLAIALAVGFAAAPLFTT